MLSLALLCGLEAQYPVVGIVTWMGRSHLQIPSEHASRPQHVPVGLGSRKCWGLLSIFHVMPFFYLAFRLCISAHCLLQSFTESSSAVG